MKSIFTLFAGLLLISSSVLAQNPPFVMELEPFGITGLPGIHSYAYTVHDNKWLIIGGRINGLHGFQPPSAFPTASQNQDIYVVDPVTQQVWSAPVAPLSQPVREHITSSNMEEVRIGDYLYFIGGYGYSTPALDPVTFPNVTAIDVPGLMNAVINQLPITGYFRQITNTQLAVSGGRSEVLDSTVYLVFGHQFDGRYNPHNGPSFTQTYTNSIKKFQIADNGTTFSINNYTEITDTVNFRRRDYNLVPQIFPGGVTGLTAYTGVFQATVDMPYHNSIDITGAGYTVNSNMVQLLNQYHTATIPFYDSQSGEMLTFFMGGIGEYFYDVNGVLTQDSLVPFVRTISYTRRSASQETEHIMPIEMPGYLGSNMEFFHADSIPVLNLGIIDLTSADTGKILVGYLFGGIESDYPYVFNNGGGNSWANNVIYKVFINKNVPSALSEYPEVLTNFEVYPNPVTTELTVDFILKRKVEVKGTIYNMEGKVVSVVCNKTYPAGKNRLIIDTSKLADSSYYINFNAGGYFSNKSFVVTK